MPAAKLLLFELGLSCIYATFRDDVFPANKRPQPLFREGAPFQLGAQTFLSMKEQTRLWLHLYPLYAGVSHTFLHLIRSMSVVASKISNLFTDVCKQETPSRRVCLGKANPSLAKGGGMTPLQCIGRPSGEAKPMFAMFSMWLVWLRVRVRVCIRTSVCICVYTHVCVYVRLLVHADVDADVEVCVHIDICVYRFKCMRNMYM